MHNRLLSSFLAKLWVHMLQLTVCIGHSPFGKQTVDHNASKPYLLS
jgi:hypothetical protein